ncbi:zinc-binding alcohol [Ceraceosorus bombacis]|uniref:Zinc-binding alcohol n=1 Tax=Ceraceosorus bombacis TaxID=401625 RepID=A0A0P1BM34_9BASI|nr:zinc-binding alcohol [Ceraceosorus bombacis]
MTANDKFMGWVADGPDSVKGNLTFKEFTPKNWTETDIELDVIACGVCASDIHTMRNGWGPADFPTVVGHEIVGKVTRVGKEVDDPIQVGDVVGIGAITDSCRKCELCRSDRQSYCHVGATNTYQGNYPDGSGKSMGGYALKWRGSAYLAIKIPDGLDPALAAPIMCGGATAYSPLRDYGVGGPDGKRVAIIGIGGIGAFGIAFAKALGATDIVAISSTASKKQEALKLGATDFVAWKDEGDEASKKYNRFFDVILNTAANTESPFDKYVMMCRPRGHVVNIAAPEGPWPAIPAWPILFSGANIGGSAIAGKAQLKEMLEMVRDKKPELMIEKRSLKDTNQVVQDMVAGKPRFRYVLVNDEAPAA